MNLDLKRWVEQKVESGQYPSDEAVIIAALEALKGREPGFGLEGLIDRDFEDFCAQEGDDSVTLQEVRQATASIPGSMAQTIIDDERAERF